MNEAATIKLREFNKTLSRKNGSCSHFFSMMEKQRKQITCTDAGISDYISQTDALFFIRRFSYYRLQNEHKYVLSALVTDILSPFFAQISLYLLRRFFCLYSENSKYSATSAVLVEIIIQIWSMIKTIQRQTKL